MAPLDNIACRQAVEYATNKASIQRAYGGNTGGAVATNLLPPTVPGRAFNLYPSAATPRVTSTRRRRP